MSIGSTQLAVMTGTSPFRENSFSRAVACRFMEMVINENPALDHKEGDFCYNGNRCEALNIGWRARQIAGFELTPKDIEAGKYDAEIAAGFHEAASSEHYYRYEKDWC